MNTYSRRQSAFTLIELLVVVAIIAMLIAILVPSLSKAKDLSLRTQCANRLRSVYLATAMYVGEDGALPDLNNAPDESPLQYNYLIFDGRDYEQNFGPIARPNGPLQAIETLYCPVQTDVNHVLNSETNPWPSRPNMDTRAGFGRRFGLSGKALSDFDKIVCFAADVFHLDNLIKTAHKTGINVVYIDGHAIWVPGFPHLLDNELANPFDPADDPFVKDIWIDLDRIGR